MRTYNLQEEDMPSLEHAIYSAFEHWNHGVSDFRSLYKSR